MARQKVWWGGIAAMAGAVVFAGWFPYFRLNREIALARQEGLWTEASDVRRAVGSASPEENAADLIRKACATTRKRGLSPKLSEVAGRVLKGTASEADKKQIRFAYRTNGDLVNLWRSASQRPRLVYDRHWEDGMLTLYPEFADLKVAVKWLAAAAELGLDSRANLTASARLAALTRQEPNFFAQIVTVALAKITLREAKRLHLESEVDALLGRPLDVRPMYADQFYECFRGMDQVDDPDWRKKLGIYERDRGFFEKLQHLGPAKANATYRYVHLYRTLWKEMPADGTKYDGAIRAIEARIPEIGRELNRYDDLFEVLFGDPKDSAMAVKAIQKYETSRMGMRH